MGVEPRGKMGCAVCLAGTSAWAYGTESPGACSLLSLNMTTDKIPPQSRNSLIDPSNKGPFPASEPEVKSIVDYVQQELENRTIMAISLHAFGQVFFMPYAGSEKSHHPDFEVHIKLIFLIFSAATNLLGHICFAGPPR